MLKKRCIPARIASTLSTSTLALLGRSWPLLNLLQHPSQQSLKAIPQNTQTENRLFPHKNMGTNLLTRCL